MITPNQKREMIANISEGRDFNQSLPVISAEEFNLFIYKNLQKCKLQGLIFQLQSYIYSYGITDETITKLVSLLENEIIRL